MAAKKLIHHIVPHHHPSTSSGQDPSTSHSTLRDELSGSDSKSSGRGPELNGVGFEKHRGHALSIGALFGYLLIFVFTVSGIYLIRTNAPQILGTVSYTAAQIIEHTNIKRAEHGLPVLAFNPLLAKAAQAKSADMLVNNYWAHNSPGGKTPWNFISTAGYKYVFAGENLARDFNDPVSIVNAWMDSPSHRGNVLEKNFKEIGVWVESGKLNGREGVLVVQMFGSSITPIAAQPSSPEQADQKLAQNQNQEDSSQPSQVQPGIARSKDVSSATSIDSVSATVLASRQFSIAKGISLALVGFIFMLFTLEVIITSRKSHLTLKSSTLAHLGLLGLILVAVWYAVQGAVV